MEMGLACHTAGYHSRSTSHGFRITPHDRRIDRPNLSTWVGTSPDIEEYDDANRCHGRRAPGALGLSRPLKTEGVDLSRAPPANSGRRRWPVNSDDIFVVIVYPDESRAQTA